MTRLLNLTWVSFMLADVATHVPRTSANSSSVKWVSQLTVQLTELGATGPK